ncbi:MAG: UDP-N-acetylmuramate dehydrogenase [Chthoniobacterales bacterium]
MTKNLENILFNKALRIHLIGVAGSGMSGLAALLLALGHRVTGSDRATTPEIENLKKQGLLFSTTHCLEDARQSDLVIYSSAIQPGNITFDEAKRLGTKMARRAEVLAALLARKKGIIICGMHGKTTTSSMAAHVLGEAGLQPSHYVGAPIPILGTNARWNNESDYFVAEGDESDGTLIHYKPEHAIVLNIEPEHLDFYKDIEAIDAVYQQLIMQTRGYVFYCADDPGATRVCAQHPRAIPVGAGEGSLYRYAQLTPQKPGSSFDVFFKSKKLGSIELNIFGAHNVSNAMLVIALACELGVSFDRIAAALETFRGAKRRFELKYENKGILVFDDYGHHPTEIAATIESARSIMPSCSAASATEQQSKLEVEVEVKKNPEEQSKLEVEVEVKKNPEEQSKLEVEVSKKAETFNVKTSTSTGHLNYRKAINYCEAINYRQAIKRLVIIFQPHRYTRTAVFYEEFGRVLLGADLVFVTDIYPAGESPIEGITAQKIVDASLAQGHSAIFYEPSLEKMKTRVGALLKEGDLLLCLGAGNIHETVEHLVADLKMRDELIALMKQGRVLLYEPLSLHTTMRVGGPAQFWVEPEREEEFATLVKFCSNKKIPLMVMGRGSNLLVRDGGIPGVVVHLVRGVFAQYQVDGMTITAGVGVKLKQLAALARQAGIGGFEWMDGIPGNLGGSLRMNAGAMGQQTFEQVIEIRYLDQEGKIFSCTPEELEIRYRDVPFLKNHYVLSASLKGDPATFDEIQHGLQASFTHRKETQPIGASAGCIFKNPPLRSTKAAKECVVPVLGASRIRHTLSSCAPSAPSPSSALANVKADFTNSSSLSTEAAKECVVPVPNCFAVVEVGSLSKEEGEKVEVEASTSTGHLNYREAISAGRLIEELGLKNHSVGKARVSQVHGNFIINDGGATAAEVLELIEEIKKRALQERGIALETEVQIVGVDAP